MQELLLQIIAMLKEIRDLLNEIRTLILRQQEQRRSP
jgi:hypothetical protein